MSSGLYGIVPSELDGSFTSSSTFATVAAKATGNSCSISTAIVLNSAVVSCCSILCLQITASESNHCGILSKAAKVVS